MNWLQWTALISADVAEPLADALSELGAVAVTLTDGADEPIYEPLPGTTPLWQSTQVTGLFSAAFDSQVIYAALRNWHAYIQHWFAQPLPETIADPLPLPPMQFGRRLWVIPPGSVRPMNAAVVELNPGQAFGSGTHPTTALCLRWLDQADLKQRQVIDYGCGSGILGIAACQLGAKQVWAVDYDPQAWAATLRNAQDNGVINRIQCVEPVALPTGEADIVLANILANPLIQLAPQLAHYLKPGGALVLSGLLSEQIEAVSAAYQPYVQLQTPVIEDNWVCLTGIRLPAI